MIESEILVEAPVDVVWKIVTEPDQMTEWFSDAADLDLRAGGVGTLVFGAADHPEKHTSMIAIEAVDPPRRFAFRWNFPAGEQPGPGNSVLVEFTLTAEGDGTRVRVVESGVEEQGWPAAEVEEYTRTHTEGWAAHLVRLNAIAAK
ncbi:SRPBCC domain-containing protein [Hamadaea tsunoensis]|uniref:SRPBCC domain-containing protein n=1 Tax=Hamadaea tsunoensis TaxID=53368 RepID=UPI00146FB53F|nr:SRPBCC domain-containing protein [Hamadaea tsunoensis]